MNKETHMPKLRETIQS